ncbi:MAG: D-alanine--D-alanine ligase [bacterium]
MKKTKVALLYGGPSAEHEVSLNSAKNVMACLDSNKFEVIDIKISKAGVWIDQTSSKEFSDVEGIKYLKKIQVDLVFIIIHGEYGEDGTIQKLLESEGIKFTGSKSEASNLAMDKVASSHVLTDANLNIPSFIFVNKEEWDKDNDKYINAAKDTFDLPVVVKPTDRGSSVGISIVKNVVDIKKAVDYGFETSNNVMIQDFIDGRELTCAVVEGETGKLIPLIPTEITPNSEHTFFDYKAKYAPGASIEITPPNLPKEKIKEIQQSAIIAHESLDCSHISRSDFILAGDTLYTLEVNTIPGMTETSLVPQGAKAAGIELSLLLEIIIEAALR